MSAYKKRINFAESENGASVKLALIDMVQNSVYSTESSYSADATSYPNNLIPFVDKHMSYLNAHPATDPSQYLANLRLMTKIRTH